MAAWLDALLPTIALIALGFVLRARLLRDEVVWAGMERLTFWVLLPALLASSISSVKLSELPLGAMAGTIWSTVAVSTLAAMGLARALGHDPAAMTSVVQGGIRFNNYIAFAISGGLYGAQGLAFGGVAVGLLIPCIQVILTFIFVLSTGQRLTPIGVMRQIALNPLIGGCLAGFAFAAFGGMPAGLAPLARSLGQAALALGLLCVGAGLTAAALRESPLTQALVAFQKLVLVPLVTLFFARFLELPPLPAVIAVLVMAMPTATTSYVMARAMGGDARLMAAMITLQHLAAVVTLPAWALALAS